MNSIFKIMSLSVLFGIIFLFSAFKIAEKDPFCTNNEVVMVNNSEVSEVFEILDQPATEPTQIDPPKVEQIKQLDLNQVIQKSKKGNGKVVIDVPYLNQSKIIYGCESVSSTMLLQFHGYYISEKQFTDEYLVKKRWYYQDGKMYGPDINSAFCGDPYKSGGLNCGFGCYSPCIVKSMDKILNKESHEAKAIHGESLKTIISTYIDNGLPVLIWATMDMRASSSGCSWTIDYADQDSSCKVGDTVIWKKNEHCLVLVGYDNSNYYFNDPYKNHGLIAYSKGLVEQRFNELNKQAVVVLPRN